MAASEPPRSDAHYYGTFLTALSGLRDDAQLCAYSREGIEHLRQAERIFYAEFEERHPGAWADDRPEHKPLEKPE